MPFAGHTPIHPRWSQHHRPTASATHTAACTITRTTGAGSLDGDDVWQPPTPTVVYTGACRITVSGDIARRIIGERVRHTGEYKVAIKWDGVIEVGDIITVTDAVDPMLVGRKMQVKDIDMGSQQWERVLIAVEDFTHPGGA